MRRSVLWSAVLGLLWSGLALGTIPSPAEAGLISRSEEARMGREAAREIEAKYRTYTDRRVSAIGHRIARVSDNPNLDYRFKVIDRDEVNAISLPGGPVYVFRGLLRLVGDDDNALAGVIAHEVAHITERHSAKQVEKTMGANLLLELLTRGRTRQAGSILANIGLLKFGREDEYEADEVAVAYMRRAGYDPRGLAWFFRQLQARERRGSSISWLRTHPSSGARAQRVERLADGGRADRR